MEKIFESILEASLAGAVIITVILVLRLILTKTPKRFICLLWMLAILRLLVPFSIESPMSLQPDLSRFHASTRPEYSAPPMDSPVNASPDISTDDTPAQIPPQEIPDIVIKDEEIPQTDPVIIDVGALRNIGWAMVAGGFVGYTAVSYLMLKRKVRNAVRLDHNIFECGEIDTPFLLGYFRPNIYLPAGLSPQDMEHILAHEQMHLRRFDNWTKLLGFLALSLHWFNPLVWVAYALLCRDIEMACDEDVILTMEISDRKEYSSALLRCASGHRMISACPVAFGEVSVKQRIPRILGYRKPAFWITLAAVVSVIFVAVCFLTDPAAPSPAQRCIQALQEKATAESLYLHTYPKESVTTAIPEKTYMRYRDMWMTETESFDGNVLTVLQCDSKQYQRRQKLMGDRLVDTFPWSFGSVHFSFELPWPFTVNWNTVTVEYDSAETTQEGYECITLTLPDRDTSMLFYFSGEDLIQFREINADGVIHYSFMDYPGSEPVSSYISRMYEEVQNFPETHGAEMSEKCRQALLDFQNRDSYTVQEITDTNEDDVLNEHSTLNVFVSGHDWLRIWAPTDVYVYYLQKNDEQYIKYVTTAVAPDQLAYPNWTETDFNNQVPGIPNLWLSNFRWDAEAIRYSYETFDEYRNGQRQIYFHVENPAMPQGYYEISFVFDASDTLISVIREVTWYTDTGEYRFNRKTTMIYADSPEAIAGYIETCYLEAQLEALEEAANN